MKKISIEGAVVFVSGGNQGIGRAIVEEFLAQGAKKVYVGAREINSVDELVSLYGEKIVPVLLEFTDDATITEASQIATDVDILINNAGVLAYGNFLGGNLVESLTKNLEVNVWGTVKLTQAFLPKLQQKENACIATISSIAGLANSPELMTYSMSKAAIHSMIQGLRGELKDLNVLVTGVYPGPIATDMTKGFPMEMATPEHVAKNVVQGIRDGLEEIYPDPVSEHIGELYATSPKAVEEKLLTF
jgi:NAD(P)-dependent dehydrogenase (short-subunit alcohol dehydrogenase family)